MNPLPRLLRVEGAILVFCLWRSADLLSAWRNAPYDRWGWLAFALWCLPAVAALVRGHAAWGAARWMACLPWLALALALAGSLGEVNFLAYWGLACALAGWSATGANPPPAPRLAAVWPAGLWLLLAVCWMPVLGWVASSFSPASVAGLRLTLAALAAGAGWGLGQRRT